MPSKRAIKIHTESSNGAKSRPIGVENTALSANAKTNACCMYERVNDINDTLSIDNA